MAGCKKCGGKTISPTAIRNTNTNTEMVLMEYVGTQGQKRRLRSKVNPREQYVFSEDSRRFLAYRQDAEWLTSMATQFKMIVEPTIETTEGYEDIPVLSSVARSVSIVTEMPLDVLTLDPIILALLKKKFQTITELRNVGRSGWMTIKGIGASRADMVAEALNAL